MSHDEIAITTTTPTTELSVYTGNVIPASEQKYKAVAVDERHIALVPAHDA